ncbi:hypothetical protein [Actinomadura alba]|uniref:hypothetical protein n=1 Tax=Actinomadura alba TaxID=406431 RepID=UPI001C9BC17E|nr:hypothetical protein [Actinomadura alba]
MERPRAGGLNATRRRSGAPALVVFALFTLFALVTSACAARGETPAGAIASPSSQTSLPASPSAGSGRSYGLEGHQPLWPFGSVDEARAWQRSYRSGGHAPWHLSADETALAFARYLGLKGVDRVTRRAVTDGEAHIGVGYRSPEGIGTAAVIHLVRIGDGADAPWEVVGTDDKELSLTSPSYGATVGDSPVTVGGSITGVDESLRVAVHQRSSAAPIGVFCCVPAGGSPGRWSAKVPFQGARDSVLTVVVTTGGHVAEVERFAVTGVRTG